VSGKRRSNLGDSVATVHGWLPKVFKNTSSESGYRSPTALVKVALVVASQTLPKYTNRRSWRFPAAKTQK
jgi:hypothetical protein